MDRLLIRQFACVAKARRCSRSLATAAAFGLLIAISVCRLNAGESRDPYRQQRLRMVADWIEREGIANPRVLDAMREVPRHRFVDPKHRRLAYIDTALPIGSQQTISPPFIVAYMTEVIDPQPTDRVLEIGTGSGYQAAVLSGLVREVYTIEIVGNLGRKAARRLKRLRYDNVNVKIGDGYQGWPEHAPFDKIIVTCSPERVPRPLVEQLKEGGKMIIPLGRRYQQVFHLMEKRDGEIHEQQLISTFFVPMTGRSEEQRKVRPDPANPRIVNGSFEADENDDGLADNWHYQRQTALMTDGAPHGERYVRIENSDPGRAGHILQGLAVDGRQISSLRLELSVRSDNTVAGRESYEKPSLVVHFYDAQRRPVDDVQRGSWLGTLDWQRLSFDVKVPITAREAVVRIGLLGATGSLSLDHVELTATKR